MGRAAGDPWVEGQGRAHSYQESCGPMSHQGNLDPPVCKDLFCPFTKEPTRTFLQKCMGFSLNSGAS